MKSKNLNSILALLVLLLGAHISGGVKAQDKAVTEFIEQEKSFTTLYFYPSTIRMLGRVFGGVDAAAFAELKSGRLMFTLGSDDNFQSRVNTFLNSLEQSDFETLADVRNPGFRVRMMQKDGNTPSTIIYFDGESGLYLVEAAGKLSPQAMQQMMAMDVQSAAAVFGLFPSEKKEEAEADSMKFEIKIQ